MRIRRVRRFRRYDRKIMIEIILLITAIGLIGLATLNWQLIQAIISDNMKEIENMTSERTKREQTQRNRDKK